MSETMENIQGYSRCPSCGHTVNLQAQVIVEDVNILRDRLALLEKLVGECKNDLVNINQLMVGLDSWQTISGCLNAIIQKLSLSIQKKGGV